MTPALASLLFLLRHELRLAWRRGGLARLGVSFPLAVVGMLLLLHFAAFGTMLALRAEGWTHGDYVAAACVGVVYIAGLMLMQALRQSLDVLYEGGDLAWLASAPLPLRTILRARIAAVALYSGWLWLVLAGSMADALAFMVSPAALAIYPLIAAMAVVLASVSVGLAVGLRDVVGLRAMRAAVLGFSMFVGAAVFVGSQVQTVLSRPARAALWQALHPHGGALLRALWWPAEAAMGAALPLLAMIAVAALAALLASLLVERRFARGGFDNVARREVRRATMTLRFGTGTWRALLTKEWRLVWRTPGLVGRALYQGVYLLPVLIGAWRGGAQIMAPVLAATPVFIGSELARLFMVMAMAGDQAPALAGSAPVAAARVRGAKFAAAALGAASLAVPMALPIALWRPALVPAMAVGMALAGGGALWIGEGSGAPERAVDLGNRPGEMFHGAVLGPMAGMAWALATWLGVRGQALALAAVAAAVVLTLIARRR